MQGLKKKKNVSLISFFRKLPEDKFHQRSEEIKKEINKKMKR